MELSYETASHVVSHIALAELQEEWAQCRLMIPPALAPLVYMVMEAREAWEVSSP